jgi:SAM-dependent methyltransferase
MNDEITKASYEKTAKQYADKVKNLAPLARIEKFCHFLPGKGRILDLGCGPGRDAKVFSDKGFDVVGVDFSERLLEIARKEAPLAQFHCLPMEEMVFPERSFDGIWANCSLLHIAKRNLPSLLTSIHGFLKKGGCFYLSLKKGSGEGVEKDVRYAGEEKFWSYFEKEEIEKLLLDAGFSLWESEVVVPTDPYQNRLFIAVICKRN